MYMVPPFLAYYGVMSHNTSLVEEAYNQLKLYRKYLAASGSNALRHVVLGDWQDNGLWATGNGWAAAGEFPTSTSFLSIAVDVACRGNRKWADPPTFSQA